MKVALFGGSFNPIHNGHLQIIEELLKIIDEVWIIPCGNHALGKELLSGEKRVEMIKLAIENPKVKIVEVEVKSDKKSFSSETIKNFQEEFPNEEFYYVIGADNLDDLNGWHNFDFLKTVNFIVVKRPGFEIENKHGIKIFSVIGIENETSSTEIRDKIKRGISVDNLVAENVADYIKKEKLYLE